MRTRKRKTRKKTVKYQKIVIPLVATIFLCVSIMAIKQIVNNRVYAGQEVNVDQFDFDFTPEKLAQNMEEQEEENQNIEIFEEEIELEYITLYETDETLPKGMIQIKQEGRTGIQKITIKKTYENGEIISEEKISDKIIKAPINKIVVTGSSKYRSNYQIKEGDTLYVASNSLSVRREKDENAEKITTLYQNTAVTLLEKGDKWYKISCGSKEGYALADSLTYINPNVNEEYEEGLSRADLISRLSFEMDVNKPSGLSLEQFKKILTNQERDTNRIFKNNAQYFYYAEKQYKINGVFLASIAIHESNWGTSSIAINKRNLFGYGAKDANPYGGAYEFASYAESIDLVARALVKYYLNPAGTKIYDGEIASGVYYNGSTISDVNKKYASDDNWANSVYQHMKQLYDNL